MYQSQELTSVSTMANGRMASMEMVPRKYEMNIKKMECILKACSCSSLVMLRAIAGKIIEQKDEGPP
jgi:hypothetical protein